MQFRACPIAGIALPALVEMWRNGQACEMPHQPAFGRET
jgi:hypothetical protein